MDEIIERLERIERLLEPGWQLKSPWLSPEKAALYLGLVDDAGEPKAETIRTWCRNGEVFQPGKETRKIGKYWQINVVRVEARLEQNYSQTRIV